MLHKLIACFMSQKLARQQVCRALKFFRANGDDIDSDYIADVGFQSKITIAKSYKSVGIVSCDYQIKNNIFINVVTINVVSILSYNEHILYIFFYSHARNLCS
jgi:hypothetical protein